MQMRKQIRKLGQKSAAAYQDEWYGYYKKYWGDDKAIRYLSDLAREKQGK